MCIIVDQHQRIFRRQLHIHSPLHLQPLVELETRIKIRESLTTAVIVRLNSLTKHEWGRRGQRG